MVGREARAKRATTAFNGGKFFFFGLEKKKVSPFCFFPLSAKLAVCLMIFIKKTNECDFAIFFFFFGNIQLWTSAPKVGLTLPVGVRIQKKRLFAQRFFFLFYIFIVAMT